MIDPNVAQRARMIALDIRPGSTCIDTTTRGVVLFVERLNRVSAWCVVTDDDGNRMFRQLTLDGPKEWSPRTT